MFCLVRFFLCFVFCLDPDRAKIRPAVVQNRVYASKQWGKAVRDVCQKHGILYQGFSILTANRHVMNHPFVKVVSGGLGLELGLGLGED